MNRSTVLLLTSLFALLAAVGWFAYSELTAAHSPMPVKGYIALAIGMIMSLLAGVGLMVLLFYSSRRGYDEPPRFRDEP